jgi:thiamine monophosphate kinase
MTVVDIDNRPPIADRLCEGTEPTHDWLKPREAKAKVAARPLSDIAAAGCMAGAGQVSGTIPMSIAREALIN